MSFIQGVGMKNNNKIQSLLITYLNKYGSIQLMLPDNVKLEIGIMQENEQGNDEITENYCWVIAEKQGKAAVLDSYNLGIRFNDEEKVHIFEDNFIDGEGVKVRQLNVV